MILQEEFRKNGYKDILVEDSASEFEIDLEDIFDLNQKPEEWAEKINKIKEIRNLNNNRILRQTDYNIETLSKKLENIYLREARCKDENDYNCNPNL